MKNGNDKILQEKEVQYYAALTNAWFGTKLEGDKTLISLSAGGIGLLVTLVTTVGAPSLFVLVLYILAILSFLACSISVIIIFNRNAVYLEKLIKGKSDSDSLLKFFDKSAYYSFTLGITLAFIIGLSAGIDKYKTKQEVHSMSDEKTTQTTIESGKSYEKKSYNGAGNLKPTSSSTQQGNSGGSTGTGSGSSSGSQGQSSSDSEK